MKGPVTLQLLRRTEMPIVVGESEAKHSDGPKMIGNDREDAFEKFLTLSNFIWFSATMEVVAQPP